MLLSSVALLQDQLTATMANTTILQGQSTVLAAQVAMVNSTTTALGSNVRPRLLAVETALSVVANATSALQTASNVTMLTLSALASTTSSYQRGNDVKVTLLSDRTTQLEGNISQYINDHVFARVVAVENASAVLAQHAVHAVYADVPTAISRLLTGHGGAINGITAVQSDGFVATASSGTSMVRVVDCLHCKLYSGPRPGCLTASAAT